MVFQCGEQQLQKLFPSRLVRASTDIIEKLGPRIPQIPEVTDIVPHILIDALRRSSLNCFAVLLLAAFCMAGLHAEAPCPANVKAIPFRSPKQHQVVVQVSINHARPSDFLLDTGTQMTVLDQSLAAELHLTTSGYPNVAGVSFQGQTAFAEVDSLQVGNHVSTNHRVLVYNMNRVQEAGFPIRGLLGEDFLSRYDIFIDNAHNVLCIDDTGSLRAGVRGGR
jgi:hypothetical protein